MVPFHTAIACHAGPITPERQTIARPPPLASCIALVVLLHAGCSPETPPPPSPETAMPAVACDPDNGGLRLPDGFCAVIVADHFANLRELAVKANGDLYGSLLNRRLGTGGLVALRDNDGDGRADEIRQFGDRGGVGLGIHDGYLYLGADDAVLRYRLGEDLVPAAGPEIVVGDLPTSELHASKTFAFDGHGGLYVSIGAPSNACQQQDRSPGSPGRDPCPELQHTAGVWRFDAARLDQSQAHGERYASGIRHALAIDWQPQLDELYVAQHGRDQLNELWPQMFSAEQGELLPAEEMLALTRGTEFSWPYCYYDPFQRRRVLAPEYGGDGIRVGRCAVYPEPVVVFPGHFGPNDMLFYRGDQFPRRYRGGAFIAFHGSYQQMGATQVGYQVVFVPLEKGRISGEWEVFADGFAGTARSSVAEHRPTGLAEGPDGSLYIADSVSGRIWRVVYRGALRRNSAAEPLRSRESKDGSR
ncbi:MAG: PQQ-dependent sugar dehydrogenase [Chromatiales bacterium]